MTPLAPRPAWLPPYVLVLIALWFVGCSCAVTRAEWEECERICSPSTVEYMIDTGDLPLCRCTDGSGYDIRALKQQPEQQP